MKVWISRDEVRGYWSGRVAIRKSKPKKLSGFFIGIVGKDSGVISNSTKRFRSVFGFTPRKGTCKEYELTLTEVKK